MIHKIPLPRDAPKVNSEDRTIWDEKTMLAALQTIENPALHLAVHLSMILSLREGEIPGLQPSDLDFDAADGRGTILVNKIMQRANKDALEKLDPNQVYHTFPDRREGSKSSLILKKPKTKKSNRILYMTKPLKEELLTWLEKLKQENGTTGQDNFKDSVMDSLEDMYVLQLHMDEYNVSITDDEKAAITAAAAQFMEDNSKDAINALGATQEIVEEYLTLETIQSKMKAAIVAGADTNVTDEEAKTGAYSYVGISKTTHQDESGNTVDYTDEEKEELAAKVADFAKAAKEDGLDAAAEDAGYTVSTGTFTQEDDSVDDNLLAALKNLKEGEVTDLIDGDSSYFVARLDKEVDEDATEETRQSIIEQRKDDLYDETLDGWKEGIEWAVKEKVWDDVNFDNLFTTIKDTETESTTEQATE